MESFTTHPKSAIVTHSEGWIFLFTCLLLLRQIFAIGESSECDTYIHTYILIRSPSRHRLRKPIFLPSFLWNDGKTPNKKYATPSLYKDTHCVKIRPLHVRCVHPLKGHVNILGRTAGCRSILAINRRAPTATPRATQCRRLLRINRRPHCRRRRRHRRPSHLGFLCIPRYDFYDFH